MRATAPEGFYTITPELMNPNSNFYVAINTGFPNSFDKANNCSSSFLMIYGILGKRPSRDFTAVRPKCYGGLAERARRQCAKT
jgi:murein L,D-transpeptidase YafK